MWKYSSTAESKLPDTTYSYEDHGALLYRGRILKGVVNLRTCSRVEADILLTDERVKAVTFVGTTGVGKQVYSKAAAHGKRVQAQCEAKNHALVLEDRNLEATVNAIINSTYGCAGMRCMVFPVVCVHRIVSQTNLFHFLRKSRGYEAWLCI